MNSLSFVFFEKFYIKNSENFEKSAKLGHFETNKFSFQIFSLNKFLGQSFKKQIIFPFKFLSF